MRSPKKHTHTQMGNVLPTAFRYVYTHGPAFLGGWEGQRQSVICNGLTQIDTSIWELLPDECAGLLLRKAQAYTVVVYALLGSYAVAKFIATLLSAAPPLLARQALAKHGHPLVGTPRLPLVTLDVAALAAGTRVD